jgi:hypothetical protein
MPLPKSALSQLLPEYPPFDSDSGLNIQCLTHRIKACKNLAKQAGAHWDAVARSRLSITEATTMPMIANSAIG